MLVLCNRLIWRSHYIISCSMSTSGAGPSSSSSRVQHQQGSNSSSGQTEANGTTTPSPPPQSSANPATTATPPVKEAKEAKPNPKMSKALSTSAKRYLICCSIPMHTLQVLHFSIIPIQDTKRIGRNHTGSSTKLQVSSNFSSEVAEQSVTIFYYISVLDPKVIICTNGSLPFSVLPDRSTKVGCSFWTYTSLQSILLSHPR